MKIFVYVCPEGCELRKLDARKILKYLSERDYEIVDNPNDADKIIFVTCGVINSIADHSLNKIKEFQQCDAELIVAGCLPAIEPERINRIFKGKTISTKDLDKIDCFFTESQIKFNNIDSANILFENFELDEPIGVLQKIFEKTGWIDKIYSKFFAFILKNLFGEFSVTYTRSIKKPIFFIRISNGCYGSCSYCAITKATGSFRSKPIDECIREFKKGVDEGYKHISVLADDTGAYGIDIGSSFPELLKKFTEIPGDYKISIRNLNPRWAVKYKNELEQLIKGQKIVQIGIPIQSASSRILKLMRRYSNIDEVKDTFLKLKNAFPELVLYTHYLLGFPTETENDLEQTLRFIKESKVNGGWVFPFSLRSGTKADTIEPKITREEISKRQRYAKKYLKNAGYKIMDESELHYILFERFD